MKKLITIMFGTLLLLSLTGCGGGTTSSANDTGGGNTGGGNTGGGDTGGGDTGGGDTGGGISSVTLSWTPPTTKIDGSGLDDLAGYQILYGTSRGALINEVIINNPSIASYVIEGLSSANYYFVVRAFNTNGVRAPYSNVVEITSS